MSQNYIDSKIVARIWGILTSYELFSLDLFFDFSDFDFNDPQCICDHGYHRVYTFEFKAPQKNIEGIQKEIERQLEVYNENFALPDNIYIHFNNIEDYECPWCNRERHYLSVYY